MALETVERPQTRDTSISVADNLISDLPLVYVSAGFERLAGYASSQIIGRNCRFLQGHRREQKGLTVLREALAADEAVSTILLNYRSNGSSFWNQLNMAPVVDRARGVTHIVAIQNELSRVRARQFILEHWSPAQKDDMAGFEDLVKVAAEELKSPLEEIKAFREGLRRGNDGENPAQRELRERTLQGMAAVQQMVTSLAVLSYVTNARPMLEATKLDEPFRTALRRFQPIVDRLGVEVVIEHLPHTRVDAARIELAARLILREALATHPPHGRMRIVLEHQPGPENAPVCVRLVAEGATIPEHDFQQIAGLLDAPVAPHSRYHPKVDMAVCKEIMAQHEGRLTATRTAAGEVAFQFEFPPDLKRRSATRGGWGTLK